MPNQPRDRLKLHRRRFLRLLLLVRSRRRNSACARERLDWEKELLLLQTEKEFERTYRMTLESFDKLQVLIAPALERSPHSWLNRDPIPSDVRLQLVLDYLAGGIVNDVHRISGVSHAYFYEILYDTMDAITPELQIRFPTTSTEREHANKAFALRSKNGVIDGCVAAMDGWLCKVRAPMSTQCDGAGPRAYFSGHYARMGINVQACCDALSRFVYLDMSHPGGVNDIRAYRESCLPQVVEGMEDGLYLVADSAYKNTDHLLTPFLRTELDDDYKDSFNFHLSQLRIRIERTFGLFVRKWGIFQRPLQSSLPHDTKSIHYAAVLHNFVISERLRSSRDPVYAELSSAGALSHMRLEEMLTYTASDRSNLAPI